MNVEMAAHKDSIDIGRNLYNEGKLPASLEQFKKLAQADRSANNIQFMPGLFRACANTDQPLRISKQAENKYRRLR